MAPTLWPLSSLERQSPHSQALDGPGLLTLGQAVSPSQLAPLLLTCRARGTWALNSPAGLHRKTQATEGGLETLMHTGKAKSGYPLGAPLPGPWGPRFYYTQTRKCFPAQI